MVDVKSPAIKKKNYTLKIPVDNIYAWGEKKKKEPKKEKKEEKEKKAKKNKKEEASE